MMFINDFVTKRIHAKMQELTLRQAIDLCEIPEHLNELGISRALAAVVAETNLPLSQWTAQERLAAICHYLTAQEQGDFEVVAGAKLSDYVLHQDYPETPYQFDDLTIVPLTGEYLEAVERACQGKGKCGDWVVGAMAASIRSNEPFDGSVDEFVQENITRLLVLPESEFTRLCHHFLAAQAHLAHGFELTFTESGIAVLPQTGGDGLPSVQFRFDEIIGETTLALWRKSDEFGANDFNQAQS